MFSAAGLGSLGSKTLLAGLEFGGGSTIEKKKQILLRAAVASLLNAGSPGPRLRLDAAQVIADVNAALLTNDAATILALATRLDDENNLGCTLN